MCCSLDRFFAKEKKTGTAGSFLPGSGFLFFFQVIFINTFYEWTKTKTIKNLSKDILITENDTSLYEKLDKVSYKENVCIELTDNYGNHLYSTYSNNCNLRSKAVKRNFIISNKKNETYNLINNFTKEKSIMNATKVSNNLYIFVSTSLIPLDSTINIIEQQLIIVSIVVLLLSIVIAYFISKRLSNPITKISKAAKLISKGKLKTSFDSGSDIKELIDLTKALNDMKAELSKRYSQEQLTCRISDNTY